MTQRIFNRCAGLITACMAVIFGLYLQMTPFYDIVALADGFTQGCRNDKKTCGDNQIKFLFIADLRREHNDAMPASQIHIRQKFAISIWIAEERWNAMTFIIDAHCSICKVENFCFVHECFCTPVCWKAGATEIPTFNEVQSLGLQKYVYHLRPVPTSLHIPTVHTATRCKS